MKRHLALSACLAAVASAQPTQADVLKFSGDVSLSVSSLEDRHGVARVDALADLRLAQIGVRRLSFEFGTYAFFMRGDRPHETYAALNYDDRFRLGVMRPAYDLVLPSVFALTAPAVAEARVEYTRAFTTAQAVRFNSVPIGASYTEERGDIQWGVSLHDADDGDFRSASAAVQMRSGPWTWAAAIEGVWDRQDNYKGLNAKLGGRYTAGGWDMGLTLLHPDANARPNAVAFDVAYDILPELRLIGFGELTENGTDDLVGIGARHQIDPKTHMMFSVTDGDPETEMHLTFTRH